MIKKITIRDVASYDSEGVVFDGLQKVNFIYGGNGTGKTTISRFLAGPDKRPDMIKDDTIRQADGFSIGKDGSIEIIDEGLKDRYRTIEKRDYSVFKNCHLEWEGRHNEIAVYNQDFKKQNLTEVMPGVFSMGNDPMTKRLRYSRLKSKVAHMLRKGYDLGPINDYRQLDKLNNIELEDVNRPYSVEPTVYSINKELERIGFTGFKLRTSSHNPYCYEIVRRDGSRAEETLSEGEVTIITFLYYLQVVEGVGKGGKKIVVIDDPISSLDYDAICVVSELTSELMYYARDNRFIEQVIMLTHNTAFHQGLSVRQPKEYTGYWKMYKRNGVSKVKVCGRENPIMGDYEQLWDDLRNVKRSMEEGCKWDVIGLPNLMRKIVETYFVDYGGYNRHKLFAGDYVKNPEVKQEIITLMKWIDEGSHGLKDNLYAGCGEIMGERYMDALEELFRIMEQKVHWKMMMREHD
jgi:wobble nucleotide-excising tRNase